jgi:hypothetical protein
MTDVLQRPRNRVRARRTGPGRAARLVRVVAATIVVGLSSAVTAWLVGRAIESLSGNRMAPWILGRATGITSYLLLTTLVGMGLLLSHPWRTRYTFPSTATRIRVHIGLSVFTLAFIVLHIVVLATDRYAGVGWGGAFVPMGASYRPVSVTLGVIALYSGLLSGFTAAVAGRLPARAWWPIHKVAAVAFVLVWMHGVLAGSDTRQLMWLYVATAAAVLALAVHRYVVKTPADLRRELDETRWRR